MGRYDNSLMEQSNIENKRALSKSGALFFRKTSANRENDFAFDNKEKAKKFSFFGFMTKKTKKNARFGGKTVKEANDSISALDQKKNDAPLGVYFDPLGMKLVKSPYAAYISSEENDEEIGKAEEQAQQIEDEISKDFNAGRAFTPDNFVEDIPDSFNMELIVNDAPAEYRNEWSAFNAVETKGIGARIKGFFRKIFHGEDPSEDDVFKSFYKGLPEYKNLESQGRAEAKQAKMKYVPEEDPRLMQFVSRVAEARKKQDNGHAVVKMNATRGGSPVSTYSFGFVPTADSGMAGTVIGKVVNPDQVSKKKNEVSKFPISYANFLRAAAKIRGTVGSMKTYSTIGYNCTSFAAEVGVAAGIDIKASDTSDLVMTHRHREQRVESPYRFAKFLRRTNAEQKEEQEKNEHYVGSKADKNQHQRKITSLTSATISEYKSKMLEHKVTQAALTAGELSEAQINENFEKYISRIVTDSLNIDDKYSMDEVTDTRLMQKASAREYEKKLSFGTGSMQELLDKAFNEEYGDILFSIIAAEPKTQKHVVELLNKAEETKKRQQELAEKVTKNKNERNAQYDKLRAERLEKLANEEKEKNINQDEDVAPAGAAYVDKEIKLPESKTVEVPQKVLRKDMKKMVYLLDKSKVIAEPFIAVFKDVFGIQGKSSQTGGRIKGAADLIEFFGACTQVPQIAALLPEYYADIMNAKTNVEQATKYIALLKDIINTVDRTELKALLDDYYIF